MKNDDEAYSWIQWSRYVLENLKSLNAKADQIDKDVQELRLQIKAMQVRDNTRVTVISSVVAIIISILGYIINKTV